MGLVDSLFPVFGVMPQKVFLDAQRRGIAIAGSFDAWFVAAAGTEYHLTWDWSLGGSRPSGESRRAYWTRPSA
jgi:hypothetical protein